MKLSLGMVLALAVSACGSTSTSDAATAPTAPPDAPPAATIDTPAPRTMGTARAMATRPDNLVLDPTFGSLGATYAFAVGAQDAKVHVEYPATSPAGAASPVLVATDAGARGVAYLMTEGGSGPFDARVFVSVTGKDPPPRIAISTTADDAYELTPVDGADQRHGDRTYRLYSAHVAKSTRGRMVLYVLPLSAAPVTLAAPEVVSSATGPTTKSLVRAARRIPLAPAASHAVAAVRARASEPGPIRIDLAPSSLRRAR